MKPVGTGQKSIKNSKTTKNLLGSRKVSHPKESLISNKSTKKLIRPKSSFNFQKKSSKFLNEIFFKKRKYQKIIFIIL